MRSVGASFGREASLHRRAFNLSGELDQLFTDKTDPNCARTVEVGKCPYAACMQHERRSLSGDLIEPVIQRRKQIAIRLISEETQRQVPVCRTNPSRAA